MSTPARNTGMTIERRPCEQYRATRGREWAEWRSADRPLTGPHSGKYGRNFERELRGLSLGVGCKKCGYLEFEHNIDGEEKAPCGGFE